MIKIDSATNCCGCASCVQVCPMKCISFKEDKQGFRYPIVNKSLCIDCGRCEKACPILKDRIEKNPLLVYAAKNRDEAIRRASSSGGIFTLLAERIISEGGVVFGARFDEDWEVVHGYAETIEELAAFRGSKYVQSRIEDNYQKAKVFLQNGRKVLFSGSPCQIAGLKSYLQKDYDNLICVDFVCHGVPSPMVWRRYLKEIVRKSDKRTFSHRLFSKVNTFIESVNFRDKRSGWKKYSFTISLSNELDEGEQNTITQSTHFSNNAYMTAFLKNIILRPSCYDCKFRSGKSQSDITLGDFWGIDELKPDYYDDLGVSLVMINSAKGDSFLPISEISCIGMTYDDAQRRNSSIYKSSKMHPMHNYFFYKFNSSRNLDKLIENSVLYKPDLFYRVLRKLKLVN